MGIIVRGFGIRDEVTRVLKKDAKLGKDVIALDKFNARASMIFDSCYIAYHTDGPIKGRPYLRFENGKVVSLEGDFPFNVSKVRFTEISSPQVAVNWEFLDKELLKLMPNGLFGFNYDIDNTNDRYPKPKTVFAPPRVFTDNTEWTDVPVICDIRAASTHNKEGKLIPFIAVVDIENKFNITTNSYITGYDDIARYFATAEFYEKGYDKAKDDRFVVIDNSNMIKASRDKEENKEVVISKDNKKITQPIILTPEERAERDKISSLEFERDMRIDQNMNEDKLNDYASTEEMLDKYVDNIDSVNDEEYVRTDGHFEGSSDDSENVSFKDYTEDTGIIDTVIDQEENDDFINYDSEGFLTFEDDEKTKEANAQYVIQDVLNKNDNLSSNNDDEDTYIK